MRRSLGWLALGIVALWVPTTVRSDEKIKGPDEATCGSYGTSVHFEKSPPDAAKRALKEEKLVFVLHISGLFEDPDFT